MMSCLADRSHTCCNAAGLLISLLHTAWVYLTVVILGSMTISAAHYCDVLPSCGSRYDHFSSDVHLFIHVNSIT